MPFVLFSPQGVTFTQKGKGRVTGVFVPNENSTRTFSDLKGDDKKAIAERYGAGDRVPLWELEAGQVVVYGTLPNRLKERRDEVIVLRPQELVPKNNNVFYLVFGDAWLVHGTREINDDGRKVWRVSKLEVKEKNMTEIVETSVSERMLVSSDDKICVAVTQNDDALQSLKKSLKPYEVDVQRLETLKPSRDAHILYKHRNFSWLMLLTALLGFVGVGVSATYYSVTQMELSRKEMQARELQSRISQIQLNDNIGYIRNPEQVLSVMSQALAEKPSAILNAGARVGATFGRLSEVSFDVPQTNPGQQGQKLDAVTVNVELSQVAQAFLIDQENIARSLLANAPWARDIKSFGKPKDSSASLEVQVKVGE